MPTNWNNDALFEYFDWQKEDRKTLRRINALLIDMIRNGPFKGIGKPEKLINSDAWSRRIDEKNRLVYMVMENGDILILACKGHYSDK
jgi:toxin YoeB